MNAISDHPRHRPATACNRRHGPPDSQITFPSQFLDYGGRFSLKDPLSVAESESEGSNEKLPGSIADHPKFDKNSEFMNSDFETPIVDNTCTPKSANLFFWILKGRENWRVGDCDQQEPLRHALWAYAGPCAFFSQDPNMSGVIPVFSNAVCQTHACNLRKEVATF